MSIQARCPNCEASYNLAEAQRGKKVRCRKCSETFVVGEDKAKAPAASAPKSAKVRRDALQTSPAPPPRTPPPKTKPAPVRRNRDLDRDDYEDEKDDRRDRRERREKSGSALPLILLIVGGVLLLLMMGGGVLVYLGITNHWFSPSTADTQPVADDPGAQQGPNQPAGDQPANVDDAMLWIRTAQTADKQNRAAEWLARATVIDAKRKDVAAMLEKLAINGNTHDAAIKALAQWAGPEDVPTLLTAVEIDNSLWGGDRAGGEAADALIRLQADGVAGAFAHRLHGFGHENAKKRLAELGPKAEKDVLPYMDSPNDDARADAQDLLRVYGTKPEAMFDQAVADLRNIDAGCRRWACDYISKQPVNEARQAEVAKALIGPLGDSKPETRQAAAAALATWATTADVPALIAELESADTFGNGDFQSCLDALVRLKDEDGAAAIAKHLTNVFQREKVYNALRLMGKVAEKAVAGYVNNNDAWVAEHANLLIKSYGTGGDVVFDAEMADLTATDGKQRKAACDYFATHPVDPAKQKQVARALEKLLEDKDNFFNNVPDGAAKALGVWGDKDSVPKLVLTMQQPGCNCWQSCVDALVMLKDERSVPVLLGYVGDFGHKAAALKALNDLGPLVETALDNIVADQTALAAYRIQACRYLADPGIGTAKSVPVLQTAAMDPSPAALKSIAAGTLAIIKKRS